MKPRIQCVLAQWNPGFTASGSGPDAVNPRFHCVRQQARRSPPLLLPLPLPLLLPLPLPLGFGQLMSNSLPSGSRIATA